mmetsp:Transcript_53213/g.142335  ORF Transcript_53213/g.142335 Transcript_53213/m.142335 type:complete len:139 (+) Transcript_53213:1030-1446(+)
MVLTSVAHALPPHNAPSLEEEAPHAETEGTLFHCWQQRNPSCRSSVGCSTLPTPYIRWGVVSVSSVAEMRSALDPETIAKVGCSVRLHLPQLARKGEWWYMSVCLRTASSQQIQEQMLPAALRQHALLVAGTGASPRR